MCLNFPLSELKKIQKQNETSIQFVVFKSIEKSAFYFIDNEIDYLEAYICAISNVKIIFLKKINEQF